MYSLVVIESRTPHAESGKVMVWRQLAYEDGLGCRKMGRTGYVDER